VTLKVHEQARRDGRQLHVGQDLRGVQRKQALDRFELHDDSPFDQDVDAGSRPGPSARSTSMSAPITCSDPSSYFLIF
jgi:hypothetical protein